MFLEIKSGSTVGNRLFSGKFLRLEKLKTLDLSLRLAAAELTWKNFTLGDLELGLLLQDGLLYISPSKISHADGFMSV